MKKMIYTVCVFALLFINSGSANDILTGRGIGLGRTVSLTESSGSELLLLPNSSIKSKEAVLEIGLNRQYDVKDLDQVYLTSGYRYRSLIVTGGFSQFGYRDIYAERTIRFGLAGVWQEKLTAGISIAAYNHDFGSAYESLNAMGINGSLVYAHEKFSVGFAGENMNEPTLSDASPALKRKLSLYGEFIGLGKFSMTGRITVQSEEDTQFGLGQIIELSPKANLFWGFATSPTVLGGGFDAKINKASLTYAASYHPVLGLSHTVTLGYHFGKKTLSGDFR